MATNEGMRCCEVCGKPLRQAPCLTCSGKGFTRAFLGRRRACDRCGGSGVLWECPDRFKHVGDAIRKTYGIGASTGASVGQPPSPPPGVTQRCPLCGGTGGIMFRGTAGPCPTCGGRGTITRY